MSDREEPKTARSIVVAMVAGTIVVGMFLPIVSAPIEPAGLINPIWGSVYGIGFAILQAVFGLYRGGVLGLAYWLFGFIVWPALVATSLAKLIGMSIITRRNASMIVKVALLASLLIAVPIPNVQGTFIERLPIFTKYIDF
jgi:hypothetical protein